MATLLSEHEASTPPVSESTTGLNSKSPETALAPYNFHIIDVGPGGTVEKMSVPMPSSIDWNTWNLMARSALLKKTTWAKETLPFIQYACLYSDRLGLDIIAGDVYAIDGRLSTTTGAKIKYALKSGRIRNYQCVIEELGHTLKLRRKVPGRQEYEEFTASELEATVTVEVDGWTLPFVYKARLSEWFMAANPNWVGRPRYMLTRSATAHALEMVVPMGTADADEAPPAELAMSAAGNGGTNVAPFRKRQE